MQPEETVVVRTFPNKVVAELAASHLRAEDIEVVVLADDAGGAYPFLQVTRGVKLLVSAENEARAKEILDAIERTSEE